MLLPKHQLKTHGQLIWHRDEKQLLLDRLLPHNLSLHLLIMFAHLGERCVVWEIEEHPHLLKHLSRRRNQFRPLSQLLCLEDRAVACRLDLLRGSHLLEWNYHRRLWKDNLLSLSDPL